MIAHVVVDRLMMSILPLFSANLRVKSRKNTTWALKIWHSWRDQNMKSTNEIIPDLETIDATTLNFFLSRFVKASAH